MNVIVAFPSEATAIVTAPKGARYVYVGRDTAGRAKIVTADWDELGRWMNDPARVAPWMERREIVTGAREAA